MPNKLWRCPECDTLNSDEKCKVCGEVRPVTRVSLDESDKSPDTFVTYTCREEDVIPNEKIINRSFNILLVFVWLLVAVIAVLIMIIFRLNTEKDEVVRNAEATVQSVYEELNAQQTEVSVYVTEPVIIGSETEITEDVFDVNLFSDEIIDSLNNDRIKNDLYGLVIHTDAEKIADKIRSDMVNGKYKSDNKKYKEGFKSLVIYYEQDFDLSVYRDEVAAANALVQYERQNFSSKWENEKWKYCGVSVSQKDNGKYCIVVCLVY